MVVKMEVRPIVKLSDEVRAVHRHCLAASSLYCLSHCDQSICRPMLWLDELSPVAVN